MAVGACVCWTQGRVGRREDGEHEEGDPVPRVGRGEPEDGQSHAVERHLADAGTLTPCASLPLVFISPRSSYAYTVH